MGSAEMDIVAEALRALFLIGAPVVVVMGLAGTLSGVFQSATTIRDPALGYAVRVVALVALIYLLLPIAVESLTSLAKMAFQ